MPSLTDPVTLPCGLVFPNRLVKAAMAEMLADRSTNTPTPDLLEAYNQWGQGGWGAVLTGNVQVDINHLGTPFDPSLPSSSSSSTPTTGKDHHSTLIKTWSRIAHATQQHTSTPCIVQLCHPGRQSFRGAGKRGLLAPTMAPSAIPLEMGEGCAERFLSWVTFPAPREMSRGDIEAVTARFVFAARVMADAGFSGVELHGAHGYLIDQFLNPKTNHRTDTYGGTAAARAKFILDIIAQIRAVVPPSFCIGIKLNSADHDPSSGARDEAGDEAEAASFEDTMTQIGLLVDAGIDFLEVSGGSYRDPRMMGPSEPNPNPEQNSSEKREAFFQTFSTQIRTRHPSLPLLLTGGFRTRTGALSALSANACDLIGIGRPAAVVPDFPRLVLDENVPGGQAGLMLGRVQGPWVVRVFRGLMGWVGLGGMKGGVGAGVESAYYSGQIARMARGLKTVVPGL